MFKVLAHRGFWWPDFPQNSCVSIQRAIESGADGIEVDLRMTSDSQIILCHDPDFHGKEIARTSLSDLGGDSVYPPKLEFVFEALMGFEGDVNLEVKTDSRGRIREVADRLSELVRGELSSLFDSAQVYFSSFDPKTLEALGYSLPSVERRLLLEPFSSTRAGAIRAMRLGCVGLNISTKRATGKALEMLTSTGLIIGVWTLDDPKIAGDLCYSPVSNIITNRVDLMMGLCS